MRYDLTDMHSFTPCESAGMCMQAPLEEDKDHDEDDLCIVCWENLREVIFYNCMHMVKSHPSTCLSCHPALQSAMLRAADPDAVPASVCPVHVSLSASPGQSDVSRCIVR